MKVLAKVVLLGLVVYSACQRGRPGGIMPANINHEEIQRMARFAVTEIGDEYEFGRVISATQQVVNGMIYVIKLTAMRIVADSADKQRTCTVVVYNIAHQGYLELEEFHCHFMNKEPRLNAA